MAWYHSTVLDKLRNRTPTGKCASCNSYGDCVGGRSARALAPHEGLQQPDPHC
ncbi:MAG TPA: hypothetical protein VMM54_11780 [Nitrospirota bacterium]|nr:hypothetical protein [Nitrospirota bacterium]